MACLLPAESGRPPFVNVWVSGTLILSLLGRWPPIWANSSPSRSESSPWWLVGPLSAGQAGSWPAPLGLESGMGSAGVQGRETGVKFSRPENSWVNAAGSTLGSLLSGTSRWLRGAVRSRHRWPGLSPSLALPFGPPRPSVCTACSCPARSLTRPCDIVSHSPSATVAAEGLPCCRVDRSPPLCPWGPPREASAPRNVCGLEHLSFHLLKKPWAPSVVPAAGVGIGEKGDALRAAAPVAFAVSGGRWVLNRCFWQSFTSPLASVGGA